MATATWIEHLPLHRIVPWDKNPKDHSIGDIYSSLRRFGFVSPLLVNESTGALVAGHGRLITLLQMWDGGEPPPEGIEERDDAGTVRPEWYVPVLRGKSFATDIEAAAYAVADNRTVELGGWNDSALADVLENLHANDGLYAIGYDADDLDDIVARLGLATDAEEEESEEESEAKAKDRDDRAAALCEKWQTQEGQMWQVASSSMRMNDHRLLIGDSTDAASWDRLLAGRRGDLLVTSPPYGVGKEYEEGGHEQWHSLVTAVMFTSASYVSLAAVNLADVKVGPQTRELHTYGDLVSIMDAAGLPLIGTRIWTKNPAWLAGQYWVSSFRAVDDYEYIGLFGTTTYKNRIDTDWRYRGVWDFGSVAKNDLHPAQFPVELPTRLILLLTDRGQLIVDPFLGSGTTMVAAEQQGRACYGLEKSPTYAAVTLERLDLMGLDCTLIEETP